MRKKRANTLLISNNKRFSFFKVAKETNIAMMNVFVTFVFKALNLRLIIRSRQIITSSSLRLNELKSLERQRRESIIEFLFDLIQSSLLMSLKNVNSMTNVSFYICYQLFKIIRLVSILYRLNIYLIIESHSLRLHHTTFLLRSNKSILMFKKLILTNINKY